MSLGPEAELRPGSSGLLKKNPRLRGLAERGLGVEEINFMKRMDTFPPQ